MDIYDRLFREANVHGTGSISGGDAVKFFQRSQLPQEKLREIWEFADSEGTGFLNRSQFFVALGLVSIAQAGGVLDPAAVNTIRAGTLPRNPPRLLNPDGTWPQFPEPSAQPSATGNISGDTGFGAFDQLGAPAFPTSSSLSSSTTTSNAVGISSQGVQPSPWTSADTPSVSAWPAISSDDLARISKQFQEIDTDNDGYISGQQGVAALVRYGLSKEVLKMVWDLADADVDGRLTKQEFLVAIYLVERHIEGKPVPPTLPAGPFPPLSSQDPTPPAFQPNPLSSHQPSGIHPTPQTSQPLPLSEDDFCLPYSHTQAPSLTPAPQTVQPVQPVQPVQQMIQPVQPVQQMIQPGQQSPIQPAQSQPGHHHPGTDPQFQGGGLQINPPAAATSHPQQGAPPSSQPYQAGLQAPHYPLGAQASHLASQPQSQQLYQQAGLQQYPQQQQQQHPGQPHAALQQHHQLAPQGVGGGPPPPQRSLSRTLSTGSGGGAGGGSPRADPPPPSYLFSHLKPEDQNRVSQLQAECNKVEEELQAQQAELVSEKHKEAMYTQKMQELVMFKSRCQNEILQGSAAVASARREAEEAEKAYSVRHKEVETVRQELQDQLDQLSKTEEHRMHMLQLLEDLSVQESQLASEAQSDSQIMHEIRHLEAQVGEAQNRLGARQQELENLSANRRTLQERLDSIRISEAAAEAEIQSQQARAAQMEQELRGLNPGMPGGPHQMSGALEGLVHSAAALLEGALKRASASGVYTTLAPHLATSLHTLLRHSPTTVLSSRPEDWDVMGPDEGFELVEEFGGKKAAQGNPTPPKADPHALVVSSLPPPASAAFPQSQPVNPLPMPKAQNPSNLSRNQTTYILPAIPPSAVNTTSPTQPVPSGVNQHVTSAGAASEGVSMNSNLAPHPGNQLFDPFADDEEDEDLHELQPAGVPAPVPPSMIQQPPQSAHSSVEEDTFFEALSNGGVNSARSAASSGSAGMYGSASMRPSGPSSFSGSNPLQPAFSAPMYSSNPAPPASFSGHASSPLFPATSSLASCSSASHHIPGPVSMSSENPNTNSIMNLYNDNAPSNLNNGTGVGGSDRSFPTPATSGLEPAMDAFNPFLEETQPAPVQETTSQLPVGSMAPPNQGMGGSGDDLFGFGDGKAGDGVNPGQNTAAFAISQELTGSSGNISAPFAAFEDANTNQNGSVVCDPPNANDEPFNPFQNDTVAGADALTNGPTSTWTAF